MRTDNPIADAERWLDAQEDWLNNRPECGICGEHIQQDIAVFYDGDWICDECLDDMRKAIEED